MYKQVANKHWMQGYNKETLVVAKKKFKKLIASGIIGLVLGAGSLALLAIPNLHNLVTGAFILSGIGFLGVFTNCFQKAFCMLKEFKIEKDVEKVINAPSIEKLNKKELELYNKLYPKSQVDYVERKEQTPKSDYTINESIIEA